MPALFALATHQALVALQPKLRLEERSLAFLDDLFLTAQPDRIQPLFQAASRCLYERARISLNHAKTRVWNAAAVEPPGLADISAADVWRGNAQLPEAEQGITVLGAPLGGIAFVRPSSTQCAPNNFDSCRSSRPFLTCRSLGCCCCTARRHGPTMHFVSYPQNSPIFLIFLPLSTTPQCTHVSVQCCLERTGGRSRTRPVGSPNLSFAMVDEGCVQPGCMHPRRFGPRGLAACRRSSAEIPTSRNILYANLSRMCLVAVSWTRSRQPWPCSLGRGLRPLSGTNSLATMRRNHLRRLRLPLPFVPARCRCGREQDALGDHRSACPRSGVLRARGGPLERACREAGAVVAVHTLVRDLNVGSVPGDDRRIEVIANGLPLWGGMQLAVDTTLVSALCSTGAPRCYQNRAEGAALRQARRAKERTYPELLRPDSRCRLVVLALEVGGFSPETGDFVQRLARARARSVPPRVRGAVSAAFARRWSSFLAAGASRAYAASLLALPAHSAAGVHGPPPLVIDVLADGGEPFAARSRVR